MSGPLKGSIVVSGTPAKTAFSIASLLSFKRFIAAWTQALLASRARKAVCATVWHSGAVLSTGGTLWPGVSFCCWK